MNRSLDGAYESKERPGKFFRRYAPDARRVNPSTEFLYYPIEDYSVAAMDSMVRFLIKLHAHVVASDRALYVHCHGGCGRAGTVGACLLTLLYPGMSADEALERVNHYFFLRGVDATAGFYQSPETDEQKDRVRAFAKLVRSPQWQGGGTVPTVPSGGGRAEESTPGTDATSTEGAEGVKGVEAANQEI